MATKRLRGKVWYIDYYDNNGKRIWFRIGKSEKAANLALKDIEVKLAMGRAGLTKKDAPIDKLLSQYLEYSKTHHKPRTTERYKGIVEHFKNFLKKHHPSVTKLSQIKPIALEKYKTERLKKVKARTVNNELVTIKGIFNQAVKWDYLHENPGKNIQKIKGLPPKLPRFLSQDELGAFFKHCPDKHLPLFKMFYYTGMRRDEVRDLRWSDVDFDRKVIIVRSKETFTPKSTEREIPIHPELMKILQALPRSHELIFTQNGDPHGRNVFRDWFLSICKKAGIKDITLHDMRHSFASHLIMKGVDLTTVKELLGHADIQTTMIYSHLAKAHIAKAVERL